MYMFENNTVGGIHYSRFYASWIRGGGNPKRYKAFEEWLKSIGVPEESAHEIYLLASNGKLELEENVRAYLKEHPELRA